MRRPGMWLDLAIIIIVSSVGMAFLSRHLCEVTSSKSESHAQATTPTVPSALLINGVCVGMSSNDLEERLGPALSKEDPFGPALSKRDSTWGGQVWRYHNVIVKLAGGSCPFPWVYEIEGTELTRWGKVLLQVGDSRAKVFQAFPDASPIVTEGYSPPGNVKNFEVIYIPLSLDGRKPGMRHPDTSDLYVVLGDQQITSIQAKWVP